MLLAIKIRETQTELFEENIFEIKKGAVYGNYSVWKEGKLCADFIGLDTACRYIRVDLKKMGFRFNEINHLENDALKKYRSWEDAQ